MADQTIRIDLIARAQTQAFGKVNAQLQQLGRSAKHASGETAFGMGRIATASATAGTALLVGVGAALAVGAKAAIDFESAFAGVRKTVDASETTFTRIATGLRAMALEIPVSVGELARIAELGGQLGIDAGGLEDFTEIIAKMAATTNLDIDEAATSMARFANVMGTSEHEFSNLGSTIVELGNNFATTESEILTFGTRLSGIGTTIGLSETDVLGLATAFTQLGEPAERGATQVQRAFVKMLTAVSQGGEELMIFADTAGVSAEEFRTLFGEDPAQAFVLFLKGLDQVVQSGGDAIGILEGVGLANERSKTLLLKGAANWEDLAEAIALASEAWADNVALDEEAGKRFETTASQIVLMGNAFRDLTIEIGGATDGIVNFAIRAIRELFIWLKESTAWLKLFAAGMAAILAQRLLSRFANGMLDIANAIGAGVGRTGGLRFIVNMVNRLGVVAAVANPAMLLLAGGIAVVGGAMAVNRAMARKYQESIELLADAFERMNDSTDGAIAARQAFEDTLTTKTGFWDRVIDIANFEDTLKEVGISRTELFDLALGDFEGFTKRTGMILDFLQKQTDKALEALNREEVAGALGAATGADPEALQAHDVYSRRLAAFTFIVNEVTAATANLRREEEERALALQQQQSRVPLIMGGTGPNPFDAGGVAQVSDDFARGILEQEAFKEAQDTMAEDVADFAADYLEDWNDFIEGFSDRLFDWGTAWDEYETVQAVSLTNLSNSLDNWVKDAQRLTDARRFVLENYTVDELMIFDGLDEGLQAQLAAMLANSEESFVNGFGKVLDTEQLLLIELIENMMISAPGQAKKGLTAWNDFFTNDLAPTLASGAVEGSEAWTEEMSKMFPAFIEMIEEEDPVLAEAFKGLIEEAGQEAVENLHPAFMGDVIGIITSDLTSFEKTQEFVKMGFTWARASALGFATLPGLIGGIGTESADAARARFEQGMATASPSKVFIKIGENVAAGFRIGVSGMGDIMHNAAMAVTQGFNPAVPQATGGTTVVDRSLTINHPHHPTNDIKKDLQRESTLAGHQRRAEIGTLNNTTS